jgi:hypothetical protein
VSEVGTRANLGTWGVTVTVEEIEEIEEIEEVELIDGRGGVPRVDQESWIRVGDVRDVRQWTRGLRCPRT